MVWINIHALQTLAQIDSVLTESMYTANDEVDTVGFSGKVGVNTANDEDEDLFRWFLEVGVDVMVVPLSLLELVGVLL